MDSALLSLLGAFLLSIIWRVAVVSDARLAVLDGGEKATESPPLADDGPRTGSVGFGFTETSLNRDRSPTLSRTKPTTLPPPSSS